jgi:Uncharacterised protein family (UPF0158)
LQQLKIDLFELELAFGSGSEMTSFYQNFKNGEVISVSDQGHGAFRYFKDVLLDYPVERERWFQFKQQRLNQRILDWLEVSGITPLQ